MGLELGRFPLKYLIHYYNFERAAPYKTVQLQDYSEH